MLLDPGAGYSISTRDLEWVRENWIDAGRLVNRSRELNLAFQAFDQSSFARDPMLALLLLWGALEAILSPSASELRFRVSANIATYLEPPGPSRAELQRTTAKLYDARSAAAHGRRAEAEEPLIATYALLKRVLLKVVAEKEVPGTSDLEARLFRGT